MSDVNTDIIASVDSFSVGGLDDFSVDEGYGGVESVGLPKITFDLKTSTLVSPAWEGGRSNIQVILLPVEVEQKTLHSGSFKAKKDGDIPLCFSHAPFRRGVSDFPVPVEADGVTPLQRRKAERCDNKCPKNTFQEGGCRGNLLVFALVAPVDISLEMLTDIRLFTKAVISVSATGIKEYREFVKKNEVLRPSSQGKPVYVRNYMFFTNVGIDTSGEDAKWKFTPVFNEAEGSKPSVLSTRNVQGLVEFIRLKDGVSEASKMASEMVEGRRRIMSGLPPADLNGELEAPAY